MATATLASFATSSALRHFPMLAAASEPTMKKNCTLSGKHARSSRNVSTVYVPPERSTSRELTSK